MFFFHGYIGQQNPILNEVKIVAFLKDTADYLLKNNPKDLFGWQILYCAVRIPIAALFTDFQGPATWFLLLSSAKNYVLFTRRFVKRDAMYILLLTRTSG